VAVAVESDGGGRSSSSQALGPVPLGFGVYNPESLYKVRFLCHRFLQPALYERIVETEDTASGALQLLLEHHFRTAMQKRQALLLVSPNGDGQTDTYRLVNGEGDGLSGLAVDVINDVAVVMSSSAWTEIHRPTILAALESVLSFATKKYDIVWKRTQNRIRQDGYTEVKSGEDEPMNVDNNDDQHMVLSKENGILYETYPYADGQKTGVYCDQRENRFNLAQLCLDKRVLDLCCYHGGFALNALVNGKASSATAVDSSSAAIDAVQANARLNACDEKLECIAADVTSFLQDSFGTRQYDVVVLDPPKLAPSATALDKARRKYHGLNRDAIKVVSRERGGLLLTCTCSAAMTQKDGGRYFLETVHGAALAAGRSATLLRVSGAASCHTQSPIAWPAGSYLTAALFFVHPVCE